MRQHRTIREAFAAIAVSLLIVSGNANAQQEGLAPYTPTTVEWFSIWGQARLGGDKGTYSIVISPREPNSIRVAVAYFQVGSREQARRALEHVVSELREEANFRGWRWLRIEESFQDRSR